MIPPQVAMTLGPQTYANVSSRGASNQGGRNQQQQQAAAMYQQGLMQQQAMYAMQPMGGGQYPPMMMPNYYMQQGVRGMQGMPYAVQPGQYQQQQQALANPNVAMGPTDGSNGGGEGHAPQNQR